MYRNTQRIGKVSVHRGRVSPWFGHAFRTGAGPLRWCVRVAQNKILPHGFVLCTKKQLNLKAGESEKLSLCDGRVPHGHGPHSTACREGRATTDPLPTQCVSHT